MDTSSNCPLGAVNRNCSLGMHVWAKAIISYTLSGRKLKDTLFYKNIKTTLYKHTKYVLKFPVVILHLIVRV